MMMIPREIITDILHRLPAMSIGRLRCVSKDWLSLLTDPQFIKTLNINQHHHLIFKSRKSLVTHPFHYDDDETAAALLTPTYFHLKVGYCDSEIKAVYICGSCNGLVLVCVVLENFTEFPLVLNPTTKETLKLPQDYDNFDDIMYGFGYESVTDDYKVVTLNVNHARQLDGRCVHVYSLRNKSWRRAIDAPFRYTNGSFVGVFVNGFIHWIGRRSKGGRDLLVIAAFSLADESFSQVPSPNLCDFTEYMLIRGDCQLVDLGGKLAILMKSKGEVWLMNEYGVRESWIKISLHGITQIPICESFYHKRSDRRPLVFDVNGKILVANMNMYNRRMMVYDVEKGSFSRTSCVLNPKKFLVIGAYFESLVSLKLNINE